MTEQTISAGLVRGALDLEWTERGLLPHRLPARAREQVDDEQLRMAESQPSGVRLVFDTEATALELEALRTVMAYVGAPPRPDGVYDLVVDGQLVAQRSVSGGNVLSIDMVTGERRTIPGEAGTIRFDGLPAGRKRVELWLPHNETTVIVALRADAPVREAPRERRTWLHHGSSISHGTNATSPTRTWPALAAARAGLDLVNLGFSGSALLDPFTARAMRDTPADLITLKLGINIANADLMRRRAFAPAVHGFLDTLREGHPTTPVVVVSALHCPIHEDTPGPGVPEFVDGAVLFRATGDPAEVRAGRLTLRVMREDLAAVVRQRSAADPNLSYVDGLLLYGPDDAEAHPLPDRLHPDAETHHLIAARFVEHVLAG
ncbi:GDSL-type esterase/lipase family protein [Actinokineospora bangkokensis]|uniref:GDSL-type esterase/lipase family protein n=1 Tax=Actinokineospora bangkokensis TaxID=1193682 RepID=UPI0038B979A1